MGRSVGDPVAAKARFQHGSTQLSVNGLQHTVQRDGLKAEHPAALRIGSGRVGSSFGIRLADRWFQSPISWFAQIRQFRISPGVDADKYPDFDRPLRAECLNCHASGTLAAPQAIGCERCHGPAGNHALNPARSNVVNPARLKGGVRDSVCEQCHLSGVSRILRPGKHESDYRPGDTLENTWLTFVLTTDFRVTSHVEQFGQSACVRSGTLWCGSCHNPHPTAARPQPSVDGVCLDCHQPHDQGRSECATCHMPKRAVKDVVHTAYTDHRIQRPGTLLPAAQKLRAWRGDADARSLGLALFEFGQSSSQSEVLQQAFRMLSGLPDVQKHTPPVLYALGVMSLQNGRLQEAIQWLAETARLDGRNAMAHLQLGAAYEAMRRTDDAVREYAAATRVDPYLFQAWVAIANVYRKSGNVQAYRQTLADYLRVAPQSLAGRQALERAR